MKKETRTEVNYRGGRWVNGPVFVTPVGTEERIEGCRIVNETKMVHLTDI